MSGSGIPPSTLSIPSPTTRSLCCGTSWLFIKVGSFGLLVVASLFPCLSLLVNLPLNSLLQICCCSHTLITFEIFILFFLSSLFQNLFAPFLILFVPKNGGIPHCPLAFTALHSLTHHSLILIILSPSHPTA